MEDDDNVVVGPKVSSILAQTTRTIDFFLFEKFNFLGTLLSATRL